MPHLKHPDPFKPGDKAAGFNVLAELGRGAASIIYLVQDPRTKQIWALKHVQRRNPKDVRFIVQAEREYEIASRLKHPTLRAITRAVKSRSLMTVKEIFLVMEYVDGISIEQHRPDTLEQAVSIFKQVAEGLAHMHATGYVHADMKPNNIVVTDSGSVKIIDLGQSCEIGVVKERIQGTPDYIAPEQVHRRPITPKTDIYNLGATMYWVLTGRHIPTALPKGDSLVSSLDDEMIERPAPVHELNNRVPERLSELVMECVEVDADKRPSDMQRVADRLDLIRAKIIADAKMGSGEIPAAVGDDDDEDAAGA